jgi:hypothetical protein
MICLCFQNTSLFTDDSVYYELNFLWIVLIFPFIHKLDDMQNKLHAHNLQDIKENNFGNYF